MKAACALVLALAIAWFGYRHFTAPIEQPPGILITSAPQQEELGSGVVTVPHGVFHLKPLARFSLDARLLHRKIYRYEPRAALAPLDLAVGWGSMSDSAVLDRLKISQSMRFFWYQYRMPPPIPQEEIIRQSTNLHIIPADAAVEKLCRSLRAGELIHLEGELVEASGPAIGTWRSSLRRDDTGNGACEVVLVRRVERIEASKPATLVSR